MLRDMSTLKKKNNQSPLSCYQCDFSRCYMRKTDKNKERYKSKYDCRINGNEIPNKFTILIPKWCPKGYKNLYD